MNNIENKTGAQYLSFMLDGKIFAFDVLKTREVLSYTRITEIPCTPDYVAGVLNLRGSVVTVMDFRRKFNMGETLITPDSAIIIVEANYEDEMVVVGALVDAVKGVLRFDSSGIEPPPKVGMKLSAELINGIGRMDDEFVVILNVDRVFSEDDINLARENVEVPDYTAGESMGDDPAGQAVAAV
ncbi:MAG TPA: chemotaxis protein CheW [Spirochaetota bacterium]|nr:chemotaxis protein CheW [Spirochaetota bacterium]HQO41084.1 chemotaxis protein CheW [Spirochaetota bacterium]